MKNTASTEAARCKMDGAQAADREIPEVPEIRGFSCQSAPILIWLSAWC